MRTFYIVSAVTLLAGLLLIGVSGADPAGIKATT
jgi:hypothetical protein